MCLFRLHFALVSCGQVRADTTDRIFQAREGTGFGELNLHRCTRIQSDGVRRPLRPELKAPMRVTTAVALAATSSAIVIFAQLRLEEGSGALQLGLHARICTRAHDTSPAPRRDRSMFCRNAAFLATHVANVRNSRSAPPHEDTAKLRAT